MLCTEDRRSSSAVEVADSVVEAFGDGAAHCHGYRDIRRGCVGGCRWEGYGGDFGGGEEGGAEVLDGESVG